MAAPGTQCQVLGRCGRGDENFEAQQVHFRPLLVNLAACFNCYDRGIGYSETCSRSSEFSHL